ncbi:hypothetical protein KIPB_002258 [Kipferlia bialata]|uniref:Uncharacterized protein n=1 Tax=Kipferlia bialata TaxID=797122 RepID=A0A9K3CQH5_9EUKA|nr:hypothetical protein KIPB_002258 [Kipferlia bialata]|eukprot:g2258.t1
MLTLDTTRANASADADAPGSRTVSLSRSVSLAMSRMRGGRYNIPPPPTYDCVFETKALVDRMDTVEIGDVEESLNRFKVYTASLGEREKERAREGAACISAEAPTTRRIHPASRPVIVPLVSIGTEMSPEDDPLFKVTAYARSAIQRMATERAAVAAERAERERERADEVVKADMRERERDIREQEILALRVELERERERARERALLGPEGTEGEGEVDAEEVGFLATEPDVGRDPEWERDRLRVVEELENEVADLRAQLAASKAERIREREQADRANTSVVQRAEALESKLALLSAQAEHSEERDRERDAQREREVQSLMLELTRERERGAEKVASLTREADRERERADTRERQREKEIETLRQENATLMARVTALTVSPDQAQEREREEVERERERERRLAEREGERERFLTSITGTLSDTLSESLSAHLSSALSSSLTTTADTCIDASLSHHLVSAMSDTVAALKEGLLISVRESVATSVQAGIDRHLTTAKETQERERLDMQTMLCETVAESVAVGLTTLERLSVLEALPDTLTKAVAAVVSAAVSVSGSIQVKMFDVMESVVDKVLEGHVDAAVTSALDTSLPSALSACLGSGLEAALEGTLGPAVGAQLEVEMRRVTQGLVDRAGLESELAESVKSLEQGREREREARSQISDLSARLEEAEGELAREREAGVDQCVGSDHVSSVDAECQTVEGTEGGDALEKHRELLSNVTEDIIESLLPKMEVIEETLSSHSATLRGVPEAISKAISESMTGALVTLGEREMERERERERQLAEGIAESPSRTSPFGYLSPPTPVTMPVSVVDNDNPNTAKGQRLDFAPCLRLLPVRRPGPLSYLTTTLSNVLRQTEAWQERAIRDREGPVDADPEVEKERLAECRRERERSVVELRRAVHKAWAKLEVNEGETADFLIQVDYLFCMNAPLLNDPWPSLVRLYRAHVAFLADRSRLLDLLDRRSGMKGPSKTRADAALVTLIHAFNDKYGVPLLRGGQDVGQQLLCTVKTDEHDPDTAINYVTGLPM